MSGRTFWLLTSQVLRCHSFPLGEDPHSVPLKLVISNTSEFSASWKNSVSTQSVKEEWSLAAFCMTDGNARSWKGWRQAELWLWRLPGHTLQGQGTAPGWRDAEGLSQGMSQVIPQPTAEPQPALHEELPESLSALPSEYQTPMHTHTQALLAYLPGSTCSVSVSSSLIKEQHLKNTLIIP